MRAMPVIAQIRRLDSRVLKPSRFRVRYGADESALSVLTSSIRSHGILRPLVVVFDRSDSRYEVLAGGRRWQVALRLQLADVPAIVRNSVPDWRALVISLADNIRDESLDVFEEGDSYQELIAFGLSPETVARRLNINLNRVNSALTLAQFDEAARQHLKSAARSVMLPLLPRNVEYHRADTSFSVTATDSVRACDPLPGASNANIPVSEIALTKREKECLLRAAEGKSTWEISRILGVSRKTCLFHLESAAHKMNVSTHVHAIARAVA